MPSRIVLGSSDEPNFTFVSGTSVNEKKQSKKTAKKNYLYHELRLWNNKIGRKLFITKSYQAINSLYGRTFANE